jgi:predicted Zn-dependent protease
MTEEQNPLKQYSHLARRILAYACTFAIVALGCSTVPEDATKQNESWQGSAPTEFSTRIETSFRKRVTLLSHSEIESYLAKVANRLFSPSRNPVRVELMNGANANLEPSVWSIPGGSVFFDVRLLRALRFENEIAAALSLAWNRVDSKEFRERMIEEAGKADPRPETLWNFSETENTRAIEAAVDRMYKSGYDPRGLVSYFDRIPPRTKKERADPLNEPLKEKARRTLSFYAPLMNPIVRTEDFYRMRKRLERL